MSTPMKNVIKFVIYWKRRRVISRKAAKPLSIHGVFAPCVKISANNVYELLTAVYEHTTEERYKICDLLEEEASYFTQSRKAAKYSWRLCAFA